MIRLFSIQNSERLSYIASIIFDTILGLDYEIVEISDSFDPESIDKNGIPALVYGISSSLVLSIPSEGLLFENDIKTHEIFIGDEEEITQIRLSNKAFKEYSIDFDILSSAFYLITEYQNYFWADLDGHGRYDEKANPLFVKNLYQKPLVDIYAQHLWQILKKNYPSLVRREKKFEYKISFDIDSPFLFKHKGFFMATASLVKHILKFQFSIVFQQVKVLLGGKDPYDVFDEIIQSCDPERLIFFFLLDRHHPHDSRFTYKNNAYKKLIQKMAGTKAETGIHPSYTSYKNPDLIVFETKQLQQIVARPVNSARMHFLKYSLPDTFQYLIKAGITDDYTLCPVHLPGFKNFISRPFLGFNLVENSMTNLMLHPTIVMDRTLQKYMQLSPEEAVAVIKDIIDVTKKYEGIFTILFHNSSLSETDEWEGWKKVYYSALNYLAAP